MKFSREDLDFAWGIKSDEGLNYEIVVPNRNITILYPFYLLVTFIIGIIIIPFVYYDILKRAVLTGGEDGRERMKCIICQRHIEHQEFLNSEVCSAICYGKKEERKRILELIYKLEQKQKDEDINMKIYEFDVDKLKRSISSESTLLTGSKSK